MSDVYELELSAELKALLLLRFKLGAVDWAAIGSSEALKVANSRMEAPLSLLGKTLANARAGLPSIGLSPVDRKLLDDSALARAESFVASAESENEPWPGVQTRDSRAFVWETQIRAVRSVTDDPAVHAFLNKFGMSDALVKLRVACEDKASKREYIENGALTAIDGLLCFRVWMTSVLFKCARLAKRAGSDKTGYNVWFTLSNSLGRTLEELRCKSILYVALGVRLMLSCTALNRSTDDALKKATTAIAGAAELHRITKNPFSIPEKVFPYTQRLNLCRIVDETWLADVRGSVRALWLAQRDAINQIITHIGSARPADPNRTSSLIEAQEALEWRWEELERSVSARKAPTAEQLAIAVHVRAGLMLTFLSAAHSALKNNKGQSDHTVELYQDYYNEAVEFLGGSPHALGTAHLLRFGAHAISQRTATRYNII